MSELPKGWTKATIGDLFTFKYGKSLPSNTRKNGLVNVYGSNGVVGTHTEAITNAPALIIGRKGSIGEVHYSSTPCYPIDTAYFVDDFSRLDPKFVYFLFRSLPFSEMNRATAIPGLSRKDAYSITVGVPPVAEQKRIATKLERLIGRTIHARNELARIPMLVTLYKQHLLTLGISGRLTETWREQNKKNTTWSSKLLGELITGIVAGKSMRCEERPPLENELGVVKVSAVTWGDFNSLEAKTLPSGFMPAKKTRISKGDFLISRANTLELLAAVVIVKEAPVNLFLSDKVLRLELEDAEKSWLLWFLRSPQGRAAVEARASGNQFSMRNLSQKNLLEIEMPWPNKEERTEIVRRIEEAFAWIDRVSADLVRASELLNKLDAAILAKTFRGELVSQDPEDEPASILLEKIKKLRIKQLEKVRPQRREVQPIKEKTMTLSRNIEQVLSEADDWLPAQTAFQHCGVSDGSSTEDIEWLYAQLRDLDVSGRLEVEAITDEQGRKIFDRIRLKAV